MPDRRAAVLGDLGVHVAGASEHAEPRALRGEFRVDDRARRGQEREKISDQVCELHFGWKDKKRSKERLCFPRNKFNGLISVKLESREAVVSLLL